MDKTGDPLFTPKDHLAKAVATFDLTNRKLQRLQSDGQWEEKSKTDLFEGKLPCL
jgi:hypothetical protein